MKVAIVGAGIMGAATAWHLARGGADVTVHEQFGLDHTRGSSHGRSRIVRLSYPDPEWVRLAVEARAGWELLERETGRTLLELHGLVEVAAAPEITSASGLAAEGIDHRFLSTQEAAARGVVVPAGWAALLEPTGGIARSDLALRAFLEAAATRGARVETAARVDDLDALDADVVVVTAGAWLGRFFPDLPLSVTRETVAYFRHEGPPLPSVVELDERRAHALFALHDPVHGVKAGAHHAGAEADPDDRGEPDPAIVERTASWLRERLPAVDPEPIASETCLYTTTPDERFVLERRGRLVIGSACSGHGFKFAPAVGARLAALALEEENPRP
jgi:monomeric sarcosine oxidase